MAGEELSACDVTVRGLAGDRAYALMDGLENKVGSAKNAKRFGELLRWKTEFEFEPDQGAVPPPVRMTRPDGRVLASNAEDLASQLEALFGKGIALVSRAPEGLILEFAAGTLGGKHSTTTQLPVSSGAPAGTLYNYAAVHLVSTSTLRALQLDRQRFRANIIVDTGEEPGFPENAWPGKRIVIGGVVLRATIPCPRCVIPTLSHPDLPQDPAVLRTVAQQNTVNLGDFGDLPCVGVYADVMQTGRIRNGDRVQITD